MTPEACCQRRWSDHAELAVAELSIIAQLRNQVVQGDGVADRDDENYQYCGSDHARLVDELGCRSTAKAK